MLKIYNTLTRQLEDFTPIKRGEVSFYQCGPTVYSRQHIGNMRSGVLGDFIRRSFEYLGYKVKFVRNITDVGHLVSDDDEGEDKMEKGSKAEGLKPEQIAKKYTDLYHQDLAKLNALPPTFETPATAYIKQMAQMVQDLLNKGFAYATELAIYFEVDKFSDYTKLSGQKLESNIEKAGHGDVTDTNKKKPYDFALWFFKTGSHKNAIQTWKQKFDGITQLVEEGFPGWHIECSAMAKDKLGLSIDIHMGGREHIPVHHTNEIAQSESANGQKFVNYWLHHEMLLLDNGKMSKSLGNVYSLDNLESKGFEALDYRYFLLQSHYRSKQNFTWKALESAQRSRKNLLKEVDKIINKTSTSNTNLYEEFNQKFVKALEDDFNIPSALSILWDMIKTPTPKTYSTIIQFDKVLGLKIEESLTKFKHNKKNLSNEFNDEVKNLLSQRQLARINKDFKKSDEIRDELKEKFRLEVLDTNEGQKITRLI